MNRAPPPGRTCRGAIHGALMHRDAVNEIILGAMNRAPTKNRRSTRLRGYDYARAGAYFVTICTKARACLFGEIVDGAMRTNEAGHVVASLWAVIPEHYVNIGIDEFIVMPNHVHGIIFIQPPEIVDSFESTPEVAATPFTSDATLIDKSVRGAKRNVPTLGAVVRAFKARVTRAIGIPVWQRNYYEHIIRNDESLKRIRQYIRDNPAHWSLDRENPAFEGATNRVPTDDDWKGV